MKAKIFILLATCSQFFLSGQEDFIQIQPKKQTIYLDVFGQARYLSLSYDKLLHADKKIKTSVSAGITLIPIERFFVWGTNSSFNLLLGQKNHHLELGFGLTYLDEKIFTEGAIAEFSFTTHTKYFYFSPKIGYRLQNEHGGPFFKINFTPFAAGISNLNSKTAVYNDFFRSQFYKHNLNNWVGLSVGYTYK